MILTTFSIRLIRWYQRTLSPDHGWFRASHQNGYCRYFPSCSEYAAQALSRHGFFRGWTLSLWRLIRCNPWSRGGVEEVR